MIENLPLLDMASAMARHASVRHQVISENVANADTPGYRARDVREFSTIVNEAFTARARQPGDAADAQASVSVEWPVFELDEPATPNGNSVSLEDQALRAVEAQGQYQLALTIYRKSVELVRLGLGRSG